MNTVLKLIRTSTIVLVIFLQTIAINLDAQVQSLTSEKSLSSQLSYSVQLWNSENGLPQNSINSITQTLDGYLWFATYDGLVRFDGVKFTIFNTSNTPNIKSNYIKQVFADKEGRLWIATSNDILKYENGVFYPFNMKISSNSVSFCQSPNDDILVGIVDIGLFKLKQDKLALVHNLKNLWLHSMEFSKNNLYLATNKGLYRFGKTLQPVEGLIKDVTFIQKEIGTEDLWVINSGKLVKIKDDKLAHTNITKKLPPNIQLAQFIQADKDFFIIRTNKEVLILKGGKLLMYDEKARISGDQVASIFCDQEKNIWVGTVVNGVNRLKEKVFQSFTKDEGLNPSPVTAISQGLDSSIWVGFSCGGINRLSKSGELLEEITIEDNNCVRSMLRDNSGNMWVGTDGRGIVRFDPKGKKTTYPLSNNNLFDGRVLSMLEDSKNRVWVGTSTGLFYYENDEMKLIKSPSGEFDNVCNLLEDSEGKIWYGSHAGIGILDGDNHATITINDGLSNNKIRDFYEDKDGTIWIGTYGGGLNRYKNGKIYNYPTQSGLINENVSCVIEDKFGYLWMTSNNGLYRVEKKSLNDYADGISKMIKSRVFIKDDGIKNIEFNGGFQPAVLKDFDERFWFPTISGVVATKPKDPSLAIKPKILIDRVTVGGKVVNNANNIEIRSSIDEVEINYTAPSFIAPQNIRFQYKLEGLNSDWINAGTRRVAYFSNIPGGEYTFRVRSYDNPSDEASFSFSVPIPIWKTWKFYVLMGSFIVLLFSMLMLIRIRTIKRKEIKKTIENKKYAEMELAALRAQMNPHFIFNCLNTIKYFVSTNDENSASKYLNKFSKLMRMFLEHSKSSAINLSEEIDLLKLYIEMENLRFNDHFSFELKIDPILNLGSIEIPSMMFQPFVENAINHGLLNLNKKGRLTIEFYEKENHLIGIVDDDGIGREKALELKNKSKKTHISRGLQIISDRIQVLNSVKNMDILIETIDKFDNEENSLGTKVIVSIPILNK